MNQTFMKEKPVFPLLLSMGIPMILSMMASSLYNIVDSIFVARISENAMTALSLVFPLQNLITAIGVGFSIGTNSVIARLLGAGRTKEAGEAATQGLLLSLLHGILIWLLGWLAVSHFLHMFTDESQTLRFGLQYSMIVFCFSPVVTAGISFEKLFQAVGRMVVSMACMLIGCIVNIILDPILIFGLGPAPAMGIRGAAWATGIGQAVTLIVYILIYCMRPADARISARYLRLNRAICLDMYAVGTAATLNMALPSVLISALNAILAPFSQSYVLVLGAYYKLQALLYQTANGLVQGMRPIVAYNYGAKEYERVDGIYKSALAVIASMMLAGTILCLAIPGRLIAMFTENPDTVRIGAGALRIICLGFIVSSVSVASSGALEGLGKGGPSFLISLLRYIIVILPGAFVLSRFLGAKGVWHSFWITEFAAAGCSWIIFRKAGHTKETPPAAKTQ